MSHNWQYYHGRTIRHLEIRCDYILLMVSRDQTFQAFAIEQLTHRLWEYPKTIAQIEAALESGKITYD